MGTHSLLSRQQLLAWISYCLRTNNADGTLLKLLCSLILSLHQPQQIYSFPCGWWMWSKLNHIHLAPPFLIQIEALISWNSSLFINRSETYVLCRLHCLMYASVLLTLFGSARYSVRLQDVSFCAAASVWPVGVHAGLAACTIHGTFIMILRKKGKRVICNKLGVLKHDPNT